MARVQCDRTQPHAPLWVDWAWRLSRRKGSGQPCDEDAYRFLSRRSPAAPELRAWCLSARETRTAVSAKEEAETHSEHSQRGGARGSRPDQEQGSGIFRGILGRTCQRLSHTRAAGELFPGKT